MQIGNSVVMNDKKTICFRFSKNETQETIRDIHRNVDKFTSKDTQTRLYRHLRWDKPHLSERFCLAIWARKHILCWMVVASQYNLTTGKKPSNHRGLKGSRSMNKLLIVLDYTFKGIVITRIEECSPVWWIGRESAGAFIIFQRWYLWGWIRTVLWVDQYSPLLSLFEHFPVSTLWAIRYLRILALFCSIADGKPKFILEEEYLKKAKVNDLLLVIERQGESFSYEEVRLVPTDLISSYPCL